MYLGLSTSTSTSMPRRSPRFAVASAALMDLPPEVLQLIAVRVSKLVHAHAGISLSRLSMACRAWSSIIDDALWKVAALARFPRLSQIVHLDGRRGVNRRAEATSYRTHYRRQLRAETLSLTERHDDSLALRMKLRMTPQDIVLTFELHFDDTLVGSWTGCYEKNWLESGLSCEGDAHRPRLWHVEPAWFRSLVEAAKYDGTTIHNPDATQTQANLAMAVRYSLSMYVTHDFRTVPLFRGRVPVDSEAGGSDEVQNPPLLHFSGGMQDLPRLLRLGPEGNSHPTWFVYLYADGTVILNLDRTEDIEFNVVDNWGNTEEMLSYLGLLVVRYG